MQVVLLSQAAGGRSWPVVPLGQQIPSWSWPWQCPGTRQLPSSQTCCAPGVTPQLGQCLPYTVKGATAHPMSWTTGGTAEVEQQPPSDKALLLFQLFKLPASHSSSSPASRCLCYSDWKARNGFLVFPENTAMQNNESRPFA